MLDHRLHRGEAKLRPTVAGVLHAFGADFCRRHIASAIQLRTLAHLTMCRTMALGGRVHTCEHCGFEQMVFHGCRDRHCPSCQKLAQAEWISQREARLVPVGHFHVVFTLPEPLRALVPRNERVVYNLFLRAACATLLELGHDPKYLGAELGVTAVLHTWTRELLLHPHVHCVVTAGGLSSDGSRWVKPRKADYLFPLQVMGALLRGKLLDALGKAHRASQLRFSGNNAHLASHDRFVQLLAQIKDVSWVTFAEAPRTRCARGILRYLGRYVTSVGLSDDRLVHVDDQHVTFATKNGETCTVEGHEFVRRFLLHVLPHRFVKIRHCGLYAPCRVHTRLQSALSLAPRAPDPARILAAVLAAATDTTAAIDDLLRGVRSIFAGFKPASVVEIATSNWQDKLRALTGADPSRCPRCGHTTTSRQFGVGKPSPLPCANGPPLDIWLAA